MNPPEPKDVPDVRRDADALLREEEASAFLNFSRRALQAWRHFNTGPAYVRVCSRAVRYRRRDLVSWLEARLQNSPALPEGERPHHIDRERGG